MEEVVVELADKLGVATSELIGALASYLPFYYGGICAVNLAAMVVSFIVVKTGLGIYKEEKDKSFFSQSEISCLLSFLLLIVGSVVGCVGGYFFFTCLFNMLAAIFAPEGAAIFYIVSLLG